jgi:REase_DpnII-MboI
VDTELRRQVLDIARYQSHPDCKTLVCFVHDPEGKIANPAGLEGDLSKTVDEFVVEAIIAPKHSAAGGHAVRCYVLCEESATA